MGPLRRAHPMNRYYFDYNATAPLADKFVNWVKQGNLPFANPSSSHYSGKVSHRYIEETTHFLKGLFKLDFNIFYHSGATEGANTVIKGWARKNPQGHFFCSSMDHSCVWN